MAEAPCGSSDELRIMRAIANDTPHRRDYSQPLQTGNIQHIIR